MSKNSSDSSGEIEEGNTRPPQISPSIRWCFTLHNYNQDDIDDILIVCSNSSKFSIFSKENGKEGETPHLQGYIEFKKKVRPVGMFNNKTFHWEKAKGKQEHNLEYIRKEKGDFWFNGKFVRGLKIIKHLRPWQQEVVDIIKEEPNDRTIHWFWESKGNLGKSALVKYLVVKHDALVLSNKATDMKYGIVKYIEKHIIPPEIIIVDIPRSIDLNYFSYTGTEEVKGGCFFSPKYECDMKVYNNPHILIFANEEPDLEKCSADRWVVHDLNHLHD